MTKGAAGGTMDWREPEDAFLVIMVALASLAEEGTSVWGIAAVVREEVLGVSFSTKAVVDDSAS